MEERDQVAATVAAGGAEAHATAHGRDEASGTHRKRLHAKSPEGLGGVLKSKLCEALKQLRPVRLFRNEERWSQVTESLVELVTGAIFIASILHSLHFITQPLSVFARIIVSNDAGQMLLERGRFTGRDDVAVLKLDRGTFLNGGYEGSTPVNRCQLKQDIEAVLAAFPGLRSFGLDFDLSSTMNQAQDECRDALIKLLSDAAKGVGRERSIKVTIIQPVLVEDRVKYSDWMSQVRANGIHLADPDIQTPFGVAYGVEHRPSCRSLGVEMGRLDAGPSAGRCRVEKTEAEGRKSSGDAAGTERSASDQASGNKVEGDGPTLERIPYQHLGSLKLRPQGVGAGVLETLEHQIGRLAGQPSIQFVLLGPAFDHLDEVTSPFGELDGVDIHATFLLAQAHPAESENKTLEFLADVILGVCMGALMTWGWKQYLEIRTGHHGIAPHFSFVVLTFGALVLVGLLWALLSASTLILVHSNFWLDPTGMALGMLIDTLVVSSVHAAVHTIDDQSGHHSHAHAGATSHLPGLSGPELWIARTLVQVPTLVWVLVVAKAAHLF